jgi:iron only hydrogenase large subunit-like protein
MFSWVRCAASKGSGGVISIQLEIDGSYSELGGTGGKVKLAPAKITLNDCLACNGCITSAGMYQIDVFI